MTSSSCMRRVPLLEATALVLLGPACSIVSGLDDYRLVVYEPAPTTSGTGTGAGGGGGSTGGAGGIGQGGSSGQGGQGGQGGSTPTALMGDDALVVRYFIDQDDDDGMGVVSLHDAATVPLDLPVTLNAGQPALGEDGGHWGLSWSATNSAGRATAPIGGTKLVINNDPAELHMMSAATIELVLKVASVNASGSYLLSIAGLNAGAVEDSFSLRATSTSTLQFLWNPNGGGAGDGPSTIAGAWQSLDLSTRKVVHMVLDTTGATADARVQLYVNGQGATLGTFTPPVQNKTIELTAASDALTLGNDPDGGRSFQGVLYYAALYNMALTAGEIANNTDVLTVADDGP